MFATAYKYVKSTQGILVNSEMFGVNTLIHRDSFASNGSLANVIEKVGGTVVRYPGGTVTEDFFDPSNPNSTLGIGYISGKVERSLEPLSDFMTFAEQEGLDVIIVLPTYRYFDPIERDVVETAEGEIKEFIRELYTGEYGAATIAALEVGNEWYQHNFQWTAAEFGRVQAKIATWVHEVALELGVDAPVFIQAGRGDDDGNGINDNLELAAAFDGRTIAAVDGLISHVYVATSSTNPMVLGGSVVDRLSSVETTWSNRFHRSFEQIVTEWNVGEDGPSNTTINGLMRSAPLLRLFATMIQSGVDAASIWTAQNMSPAALSGAERGGEGLITPTGLLFRMLSTYLRDTTMQPVDSRAILKSSDGTSIGYSYSFDGEGRTIIVMSSGVNKDVLINADISSVFGATTHIFAMVLGEKDGSDGSSYKAEGQISILNQVELDGAVGGDGQLQFKLEPFETIMIVVSNGVGVNIQADPQSSIDDLLIGSIGDDTIAGFNGNDSIFGMDGDDAISPGSGEDFADGGSGDDTFFLTDEFSFIDGGTGTDRLDFSRYSNGSLFLSVDGSIVNSSGVVIGQYASIEEVVGTQSNDTVYVPADVTFVDGGSGRDTIFVLTGDATTVLGGMGDDRIFSKVDHTTIYGGEGNDRVFIYGLDGLIFDDIGDDQYWVGGSFGYVQDGGGDDFYDFSDGYGITADFTDAKGQNVIYGFSLDSDRILLSDDQLMSSVVSVVAGSDGIRSLLIESDDFSIVLVGIDQMPSSNFSAEFLSMV